jgi:hypothetical protein
MRDTYTGKKDKEYRFRLPNALFEAAMRKAEREDLTLAQVLRRFLREWVTEDAQEEAEQG